MSEQLTPNEFSRRNTLKETKPLVYDKTSRFVDKFNKGESIAIIQLQYNYMCNMRCQHCAIERLHETRGRRRLTPADVADLAQQADALGLARFTITGGEPLIFPDLAELVNAINPQKFYINCDSNGWFLEEKAAYLKEIGIDRVQLSIDSLNAEEHDLFRRMPGAHARALRGIEECRRIGLGLYVQTVVTKERLHSDEFIKFIEFFNNKDLGVFVSYAKPVGAWEGCYDNLVNREDMAYMRELERKYKVFTHLSPGYGLDMGCIAVKGMISVTEYGDVLPCPYIHISIGNIFNQPLADIIQTGLNIKYFGEHVDTCLIAEDLPFIKKHIEGGVYGKPLPVPHFEIFSEEDNTRGV